MSRHNLLNTALRLLTVLVASLVIVMLAGTSPPITPEKISGIDRYLQFDDFIFCGAQPKNELALDELKKRGIKTIICVDGTQPQVAAIQEREMNVMHVPLGYGISTSEQRMQLAAALHLAGHESPIYIHCHHGYHRSGAAAAIASIATGRLTHQQALDRMKRSGTSPAYHGLWKSVRDTKRLELHVIEALKPPPTALPAMGMVASMLKAEELMDQLDPAKPEKWEAQDAAQLADVFRQLRQNAMIESSPASFASQMTHTFELANALETRLASKNKHDDLMAIRNRLAMSCQACHASHRN